MLIIRPAKFRYSKEYIDHYIQYSCCRKSLLEVWRERRIEEGGEIEESGGEGRIMIELTPYLNVLKIKWKGNRYPSPLFGHFKNFSWGSRGEGNDHII